MSAIEKQLREDVTLLSSYKQKDLRSPNSEKVHQVALDALQRISTIVAKHSSEVSDVGLLSEVREVLSYFYTKVHSGNEFIKAALLSAKSQIIQKKIARASTCFEVRTGRELVMQDFSSAIQPPSDLSISTSSAEESERKITARIVQMKEERELAVPLINLIYERLFPAGVFAFPEERVCGKYFPRTFAWYIGSLTQDDRLLEKMVEIGAKHNIAVVPDVFKKNSSHSNVSISPYPVQAPFPQDYMDFTTRSVQVPPSAILHRFTSLDEGLITAFTQRIYLSREKRCQLWRTSPDEEKIKMVGSSYSSPSIRKAVFLAEATNISISMNLSYNEGGNTLLGQDQDGPYAIIGLDSFEATKHFMPFATHDEIKKAFAIDYKIPEERLYFIEQPGEFHLDMSMAIVGERTILLNDAQAAYMIFAEERRKLLEQKMQKIDVEKEKALQEAYSPKAVQKILENYTQTLAMFQMESNVLSDNANRLSQFEDLVQSQLEGYGFTVLRRPGRFDYGPNFPAMNFFNMVTATTPSLEKIVVAMGCVSKEYEDLFKSFLQEAGIQDATVYFLPLEESQHSLSLAGGVSCRTKTIPF